MQAGKNIRCTKPLLEGQGMKGSWDTLSCTTSELNKGWRLVHYMAHRAWGHVSPMDHSISLLSRPLCTSQLSEQAPEVAGRALGHPACKWQVWHRVQCTWPSYSAASFGSQRGQPPWQPRPIPTAPAPQAYQLLAAIQQEHAFVRTSGPTQLTPHLCSIPFTQA